MCSTKNKPNGYRECKNYRDIKTLFEYWCICPELRKLVTTNPSGFSRNRKLSLTNIVGMLINLPKRSLSIELQSYFENLGQQKCGLLKGAFSLQRTKLKPLFFKVWNDGTGFDCWQLMAQTLVW